MKTTQLLLALALAGTATAAPEGPTGPGNSESNNIPELKLTTKALEEEKAAEAAENGETSAQAAPEEADKSTAYVIASGDTLGKISEQAYGRTRYWRILKLHNGADPNKLKIDQVIKAPELPWLFANSGLTAELPALPELLLKIKSDLSRLEDARGDSKTFSEDARKEFDQLATEIGSLYGKLKMSAKDSKKVKLAPYATMKQLQTCRRYLNAMAAGKKIGKRNLPALVHEHLSNAMVYAVLWAKDGFK